MLSEHKQGRRHTMPVKPTEQEEEYFARLEFERKKKALHEQQQGADEATQQMVTVQFRCPKCGADLVAVTYQNVEIDKCTRCQGVWLDCGELEKVAGTDQGFMGALKRIFA